MQVTENQIHHPFADLLGLQITARESGFCECSIPYADKLLNPNGVIHGGVIYSLADTGMGGALHAALAEGELCATIEIKITYLHAAKAQDIHCRAQLIKKGRRVAMLESEIFSGDKMVAKATGSFAVFSL